MACNPTQATDVESKVGGNNDGMKFLTDMLNNTQNYGEREEQARVYEEAAAADAMNEYDEFASSQPESSPMTASDRLRIVREEGDPYVQMVRAGHDAAVERIEEANAYASETTKADRAWLNNITMGLANAFKDKLATVKTWGLLFAGQKGLLSSNNRINSDLDNWRGQATGYIQEFNRNHIAPLVKAAEPLARRTGMTTEEFLRKIVGMHAIYEHIPEANQHLRELWQGMIDAEYAKDPQLEHVDMGVVDKYQRLIEALDANIDEGDSSKLLDDKGRRVLRTAAFTNGEAARMMQEMYAKHNLTAQDIEPLTAMLREAQQKVEQDVLKGGLASVQQAERLPFFQKYVPLLTARENILGATGDPALYTLPLRAREGIRGAEVVDAFSSILRFAQRTGAGLAQRDLGYDLIALKENGDRIGRDVGLEVLPYSQLMKRALDGDRDAMQTLNSPGSFGIVVNMPAADGGMRKYMVRWKANWEDNSTGVKFSGAELNAAMNTMEQRVMLLSQLGWATSKMSMLYTYLNPIFAPVNSQRDGWERLTHMGASEYKKADGTSIAGWRLIPAYMKNYAIAGKALLGIMSKGLDMNTEVGKQFSSYVRQGLKMEYNPAKTRENTVAVERATMMDGSAFDVNDPNLAGFKRGLANLPADAVKLVGRGLHSWNDYFNNIASFAQYKTLLDAGLTEADAGNHTRVLMNLQQHGIATPFMRAFWPFQIPTVQSVAALCRTCGLAPRADGSFRPNMKGVAMMGAQFLLFSSMLPMMRESLGRDENGEYRFDNLNVSEIGKNVIFGDSTTGRYAKMALGFGPMQVMATAAASWDRVKRGLMAPGDMAVETVAALMRNISPTGTPQFSFKANTADWIAQALSPDLLSPIVESATNRTNFGKTITWSDSADVEAAYLHGSLRTPAAYHKLAKLLHGTIGWNVAPEQVEHMFTGYANGPLRLLTNILSAESIHQAGYDKTNQEILGPTLSAIGAGMAHGTAANGTSSHFYRELERLQAEVQSLGVRLRSDVYGGDHDKRVEYQRRALEEAGMDEQSIERYFILTDAQEALKQESKKLRKREEMENWWDSDDTEVIKSAFREDAERRHEIQAKALEDAGLLQRS